MEDAIAQLGESTFHHGVKTMRIQRNASCPCRSGKKFKKCCWLILEEARAAPQGSWLHVDELSNQALEYIRDERWEDAENACRELRRRCPDYVDWLDRRGILEEARGRFLEAASYYRKVAVFMSQMPGFEPESVNHFWELAESAEAMALETGLSPS